MDKELLKSEYLEMRNRNKVKEFELPKLKMIYEPVNKMLMTKRELDWEIRDTDYKFSGEFAKDIFMDNFTKALNDKNEKIRLINNERNRQREAAKRGAVINLERTKFWNNIGV